MSNPDHSHASPGLQDGNDFYEKEGFNNLVHALLEQSFESIAKNLPDAQAEFDWLKSDVGQGCLQVAIPSIDSQIIIDKLTDAQGGSAAKSLLAYLRVCDRPDRNDASPGIGAAALNEIALSELSDASQEPASDIAETCGAG